MNGDLFPLFPEYSSVTPDGELAIGFYADSGFGTHLTGDPAYTSRVNLSPNGFMDLLVEDTSVNTGARPAAGVTTGPSTTWRPVSAGWRSCARPGDSRGTIGSRSRWGGGLC